MSKKGRKKSRRAEKNLRRRLRIDRRRSRRKEARTSPLKEQVEALRYVGADAEGFDYGIRPRIMLVGDMSFINLFGEAKCVAVAYTVLPQHGVLSNVPAVGLVFENAGKAQELFRVVGSWTEPPSDPSAVALRFVEDVAGGQYFFCMGQSFRMLVTRVLGPDGEKDYDPLIIGGTTAKGFPLSHWLGRFKQVAHGRSVLVYPVELQEGEALRAGNHPAEIPGKPRYDLGLMKDDIRFLNKADLTPGDENYYLTHLIDGKERTRSMPPPLTPPTPEDVFRRRSQQMKRFFTVPLTRFAHNATYVGAKASLLGRYADWQVDQAACNLLARANWPECSTGDKPHMGKLYDKLRSSVAAATDDGALYFPLAVETLTRQINADVIYLHSAIFPDSGKDAEEELRSKEYL